MKRSSPRPLSSAGNPGSDELDSANGTEPKPVVAPRRPSRKNRLAAAFRWLHIYLSMVGLGTLLFFGVTGITLNHPEWTFGGAESVSESEGQVDPAWLVTSSAAAGDEAADRLVKKLEVVEHLRKEHGVRGALAEFRVDDRECMVTFKGPGYSADAFMNRETGRYRLTESRLGLLAVINDLHKGRDTGPAWAAMIDLSAGLTIVISLTGLVLLFYIKRRRVAGVVVGLAGAVALAAIYYFCVP